MQLFHIMIDILVALYYSFFKLFCRNIWVPINRLGLSHSTNSDQMLPIDVNGVNRTANRKVLSQNKCMMHDIIGCNKESCDRNNEKEC